MHIYREISSAQVNRQDSNPNNKSSTAPLIPTRTSSLNSPDNKNMDKFRKLPTDIFERYLKNAYNPNTMDSSWNNRENNNIRHSFRGLNGHRSRALSPSNNNNIIGGSVRVHNNPSTGDREGRPASNSPPIYKIRARSNSFKENHSDTNNGWISVGPEFSIKPANGIQPIINVTILPLQQKEQQKSPEPDYNINNNTTTSSNHFVADRIIGNGNVTVQSLGNNSRLTPASNSRPKDTLHRENHIHPNSAQFSPAGHPATAPFLPSGRPVSPSSTIPMEREKIYSSSSIPAVVPPHSALPPVPQEKERSRLSTLLRRRNSSISRAQVPTAPSPFQRTYSVNLKPALKKRSSSQGYFEPKKSVTFSDYTTVYS